MGFVKYLLVLMVLCFCVDAVGQVTTVRGEDEDEFKRTIKTDTKGRIQGVQAQKILSNCDAITGWTALSNDTTGIAVDLDHTEGSNSLEFDKVDGSDSLIFGGIQKTITSVDIEHYMENNGFIMESLNVSSVANLAYCFIRLGTDASHYNEWRVDDDALSVGWNQIRYAFYVPSTAGNTGNGMDAAAITYIAVGCAFDLETNALADIRVDNIAVNTGFQTSADLQSQVSTATATPNINLLQVDSQPVDVGSGNLGLGTQRIAIATDDVNQSAINAATDVIDDWDEVHDVAVGTDGALQMNESKDFDGAALPTVVSDEGDAVRKAASMSGVGYQTVVNEDGSETPVVAHDDPISAANGGSSGLMPMRESKDFDGAALPIVVDNEGDAVRPAASLSGVGYTSIVSESGAETPLVAHDAPISAANGGSSGLTPMLESKDFDGGVLPNVVDTEGDAVRPAGSLYGVGFTSIVSETGAETPLVAHDSPISAANGGSSGLTPMLESKDFDGAAMPSVVDTEGDAVRPAGSLSGVTYTSPVTEDGAETPLVAHDAPISAANGGSSGLTPMEESKDFDGAAFPNAVDTEGDAVRPAASKSGVRYFMLVNEDGSAIGTILISSELVDSAAFTPGTSYVSMSGLEFDDTTPVSVHEGDGGAQRMSANRNGYFTLRDSEGNERGQKVNQWNAGQVITEQYFHVDTMDVTTNWAAANDATTGLATSANHVEGVGSLVFNKANGTGFTEGYIEKTISSLDVSPFQCHSLVEWNLYVSSLTDVAYTFLRLGTDASNYSEWRVLDEDLTVGKWNPIAIQAGDVEYTVVGTGIIASAVTYVAIGVSFDLEDDLLASIGLDDIMIHESSHTTATIAAEVTSTVTSANFNLHKVGNQIVNKGAGAVGTGTQRVVLPTDGTVFGLLTSDNDAKELAAYYDATEQLPPLYVDDATLAQDNEPMADVMGAIFELFEDVRLITSADGMAYTEDGLKVEAAIYGDNGASLDMIKLGAGGEVQMTDTKIRPGENAGIGAREIKIAYRGAIEPAKQGPTAVDDAGGGEVGDIVFTSRKILTDNSWCVYIQNTGGGSGDVLTNAILLTSPTGVATEFEVMPWTSCDTLASGAGVCSYCSDMAAPWIQVEALCGGGDDTEVEAWYKARK